MAFALEREKQDRQMAKFNGRDLHDRLIVFYITHAPEKLSKTRKIVDRVQQRAALIGAFEAENELNKTLREVLICRLRALCVSWLPYRTFAGVRRNARGS
jgi:hypothetical protein